MSKEFSSEITVGAPGIFELRGGLFSCWSTGGPGGHPGGKFFKLCSSSEGKTFQCLRSFLLRLQLELPAYSNKGGVFSVVRVPVAQVVIRGGKFFKPCSSSEGKTFQCLRSFLLRLQLELPAYSYKGGVFSVVGVPVAQVVIQGVNFSNHSHPQREKHFNV